MSTLTVVGKKVGGAPVARPAAVATSERYDVIGELGRGGLGRILLAWDRVLRRRVAIKELLDDSPEARSRFLRETYITAQLEHPSILPIYDAGASASGEPFLAMRLVEGWTLGDAIDDCRELADRMALVPAVVAVADAVAYAHARRIIHRDLKPSNVLLSEAGETFVIDWGLAKDLSADDCSRWARLATTCPGTIMGTLSYMPPEQARGADVDERADVYAIGAILYRLVAGVPPFTGETHVEVLPRLLREAPVPLAERVPDAPAALCAVVGRAIARRPSQRHRNAAELAAELRAAV